jgi:hypothetical protein
MKMEAAQLSATCTSPPFSTSQHPNNLKPPTIHAQAEDQKSEG